MTKALSPTRAWGIVEPGNSAPNLYTLKPTRRLCIEIWTRDCQAWHRNPPYTPTWADLRKEGYRCVQVEIRTLTKKRKKIR